MLLQSALWGSLAGALVLLAARAEPEPSLEELFRKGVALFEQGRDLEALQVFRAAADLAPDNARVHFNLGMLLDRLGNPAEALAAFRRAADLEPGEPDILLALGESLFWAGKLEDAAIALKQASSEPEAVKILAATEQARGNTTEARAVLQDYLEMRPDDLEARLALGEQLAAARRYDEAIAVWKGGLTASEPGPVSLLFRIGEVLARRAESHPESLDYLRRVLALDPSHEEARLVIARLLVGEGRFEEAAHELERVAADHPDSAQAHFAVADVYRRLGRRKEAEAAQERFHLLAKRDEERERRGARIAMSLRTAHRLVAEGALAEAESELRSVLEIEPSHPEALSLLARIDYSRGDLNEAQEKIARAIEAGGRAGEHDLLAGLVAAGQGRAEEAERAIRRALELDPGLSDAWSVLGVLAADSGRYEEAVEFFLKEAALSPSSPAVHLNLAAAYQSLGKPEESERAMARYRALLAAGEKR